MLENGCLNKTWEDWFPPKKGSERSVILNSAFKTANNMQGPPAMLFFSIGQQSSHYHGNVALRVGFQLVKSAIQSRTKSKKRESTRTVATHNSEPGHLRSQYVIWVCAQRGNKKTIHPITRWQMYLYEINVSDTHSSIIAPPQGITAAWLFQDSTLLPASIQHLKLFTTTVHLTHSVSAAGGIFKAKCRVTASSPTYSLMDVLSRWAAWQLSCCG